MKREKISKIIGNIHTHYIQEAADYNIPQKARYQSKQVHRKLIPVAAILIFIFATSIYTMVSPENISVAAYARGADGEIEEITEANVILNTGKMKDSGEFIGKPLMFYLTGNEIETVRFSCKNQLICFTDWTETREEYGNAQNFTVDYGPDESIYYYLTIDWIPQQIDQELSRQNHTIASLSREMREDLIVMEITFANQKTVTKAIRISLLDDGRFSATFQDYQITEQDDFVRRPDSVAIPRDVLYGP